MTDKEKLAAIRAEIEKRVKGYRELVKNCRKEESEYFKGELAQVETLLLFIDSMQLEEIPPKFPIISQKENPVCALDRKVLCDGCDENCEYNKKKESSIPDIVDKHFDEMLGEEPAAEPIDFEQKLYKAFGQVKDFTLGMRIAKWFYDMGRKYHEPVSEDLEEVARNYGDELDSVLCACEDDDSSTGDYATEAFKAGAQWQKRKDNTSVSEDLEKASKEWLRQQLDKSYANYGEAKMMELTHFDGYAMLDAIEFGAKWGKNQAMAEIQAQSMALVHSCPKEFESEDLKEAAKQYLESSNPDKVHQITNAFKAGAKWQKEQIMANAVDGVVHHFEKCKVASVHYNDPTGVPMAYFTSPEGLSAGDKVKIIVIKMTNYVY